MPRGRPRKNLEKSENPQKTQKNKKTKKPTFEESIDLINVEINKRKGKWNLTVFSVDGLSRCFSNS